MVRGAIRSLADDRAMIARELTRAAPKRLSIRAADGETSDAKNGLLYHCSSFALFLPSFSPRVSLSHAVDGESPGTVVAPLRDFSGDPAESAPTPGWFFSCVRLPGPGRAKKCNRGKARIS